MTADHTVNWCTEYDRLKGEARSGHARAILTRNVMIGLALVIVFAAVLLLAFGLRDWTDILRGSPGALIAVINAALSQREATAWVRIIEGDS